MTNTIKEVKGNQEVNEVSVLNREDVVTDLSPTMFEDTTQALFSTIKGEDRATRVKVYNAISDSENALDDHKGEILEITDMVAHPITLADEVTGEDVQCMRIVLLTNEGVGYHSVSQGVASSMQRIISLVGQGPWTEEPLKVVATEKKTRKGFKTHTLKLQG
jgi:Phage Single-stranded DNA-binding protein